LGRLQAGHHAECCGLAERTGQGIAVRGLE
jgi:hypothetical protein